MNAYQEHVDHEFGASFDDVRERYASSAVDADQEARYAAEDIAEAIQAEAEFWASPSRPFCAPWPSFPAVPRHSDCCESGGPDDILF